jgi:hypothetical protein
VNVFEIVVFGRHPPLNPDALVLAAFEFDAGNGRPVPHAGVVPVISLIVDRAALARWNEDLVAQPLPVEVFAVPALGIEAAR